MPDLFIITGSNGSGKSTVGTAYLPAEIRDKYSVFDGDKLYMEKQKELWRGGMRAIKEAKKIAYQFVTDTFDRLVDDALTANESFVYEGHFTNDATWDIPKKFKEAGYRINMIFFGLAYPELSEMRVIARSKEGGHYVDPITVRANFFGNLEKLNQYFELIDFLQIMDTSETEHLVIAIFDAANPLMYLPKSEIPKWFADFLPSLYAKLFQ